MGWDYRFPGFPEGPAPGVTLPDAVFSELLPHLDDLDEVTVVLHVLWRLSRMRSTGAPWITDQELRADTVLQGTFARRGVGGGVEGATRLRAALEKSVAHGILLAIAWQTADSSEAEMRYLANNPQGRATVAALGRGVVVSRSVMEDRPNIFTLYEQNIGPLTALLAEELAEAEGTYPAGWIEDAFREAVRLNKRNWKYILAILERWQIEGRGPEGQNGIDRRSGREAGKRDREAETRQYIEDAYDRIVRRSRSDE